jgi:tRNA pseudouridine38-40 synthase
MDYNVKLIISYDGSRFFGWQKTRTGPSIQEELEKAIARILGAPIEIEAASRTDRGVHAQGQVVHFLTNKTIDPFRLRRALNAVLPEDISVRSVDLTDNHFHPTLHALSKEYHYWICNCAVQLPMNWRYSWHVHNQLDFKEMENSSRDFLGTHDFSAFTNEPVDDAVRTIEHLSLHSCKDSRIRIEIRADRFLYKMVRNIVGTLVDIGRNKIAARSIPGILASKQRKNAGMSAPAHGLFLMEVFYPGPIQ